MMMDPGEIVRTYKAAKNPKEQVKILAELNCTSTKAIAIILQDAGCQVDKRYLAGNLYERATKASDDKPEVAEKPAEIPMKEASVLKQAEGCWLTKTEAIILADMIETGTFDAIRNDPEINSIDWLIGICRAYEKLRSVK